MPVLQYRATASRKDRVEYLVACKVPVREIALAMGIAPAMLRAKFAAQLAHGAARKRAELVDVLWAQARKGNMTAVREIAARMVAKGLLIRPAAKMPAAAPEATSEPRRPRAAPLGKKLAAKEAAKHPDPSTPMGELMAERAAIGNKVN